jgi:DNA-binding protein
MGWYCLKCRTVFVEMGSVRSRFVCGTRGAGIFLSNGASLSLSQHYQHTSTGGEQRLTEKPPERVPSTRSNIPSNTVLVGQKELMAYCTAIVMQINSGTKELSVKARGRVISKAVDIVEVCRRRFFDGKLEITGVNIGTEVLGEEGQTRNVSTIEIKLRKKD